MPTRSHTVLISGASVAGPMTAYWLCRQGFEVTVVERMPLARVRTGGHAVDLFGPALDVAEWAGILPAVLDARTRTDALTLLPAGGRPVDVDLRRLVAGISSRHVEIMRGELATILYEATLSDVEYVRHRSGSCGRCTATTAGRSRGCSPRWTGPTTSTSTPSARS